MCLMMVWWLRTCFKLLYLCVSTIFAMWLPYLRPYLSSSHIQMAALGHTSTPFCFVIRQLLGFFPGQVHPSEVPFDDIYPVLPRSSWLSLVTSQLPVCCLTNFCLKTSAGWFWYCWLGLLTCKNRRLYNLYCVGGDVKPCSINQPFLALSSAYMALALVMVFKSFSTV